MVLVVKSGNHGYVFRICGVCHREFQAYNISGGRIQLRCESCQREYEKLYRKYKQVWGKLGTRDVTMNTNIILNDNGKLRVKGSKLLEEYKGRDR